MRLTIRGKLVAVVCLALLPIALLGYLFVAQSQKDIAFSTKEVQGTQYFAALADDLAALSGGWGLMPPTKFEAARAAFDGVMGSAERAEPDAKLRGAVTAPPAPAETRTALISLLTKIGDASNLILDPDLDSFYVMDMIVVKLPAAFDSSAALLQTLNDVAAAPTEDARIELVARRGAFDAIVAGTETSLQSSIAGNADGQVKQHLSKPVAAFAAAAAAFSSAVDAAGDAIAAGTPVDLAKPTAAQLDFVRAADAANKAANAELTRLLEARISGFATRLTTMLAIAAALVIAVFVVSFFFARSILATIRQLERDVTDVANHVEGATITHAGARDEIADVARAVAYLQERTIERLEHADTQRRAGLEESARLERDAVAAREENLRLVADTNSAQREMVAELSAALARLAGGDLDCAITTPRSGELEALRLSFNRTVEELENMVRQMRDNSSTLRTATSEILAGSNDLAERTARQTDTIETTTHSIRKVSDVVARNVAIVKDASANGSAVSQTAENTASALTKASDAMSRIADSSARISNIIGVIDDIAFQTNLLALNASVEAARAGDAGKGFAVVAIEVRRLAQSAASASSDVKALIEESGGYVAEGNRLVTGTAELLKAMLQAATRNGELLDGIASHSTEQTEAIASIRGAFEQLEEMTQQNAALVEETNAAIEQTESLANDLDTLVSRFRSDRARKARAA